MISPAGSDTRPITSGKPRPVVMVTSSYPRFPGDGIGSFLEPIAHGVAARRPVHVVAPWHPDVQRPSREGNVHFHYYRYAPTPGLHVFGYATSLRADVALRPSVYAVTPIALAAGCRAVRRVVRAVGAELVHTHWVIPSGAIVALSNVRVPLVVSLHGSDIFLAERNSIAGAAARMAFKRAGAVTACSEDLLRRALRLGAREADSSVVPYGVDTERFAPDPVIRAQTRQAHALSESTPLLVTAGRLVGKKGFEYLIDALPSIVERHPNTVLVVLGEGDLEDELKARATRHRLGDHVRFIGAVSQTEVGAWLSAADIVVVPSVRDDAGNVDGLPNVLLEGLASGTPVVATRVGGIESVATDGDTARLTPERDASALAEAIDQLLAEPKMAQELGRSAREEMRRVHSWTRVADRFDAAYTHALQTRARVARP